MLHNINACQMPINNHGPSVENNRHQRNEKDDMKNAIDALYEFKRKLDELHPSCTMLINNMIRPY